YPEAGTPVLHWFSGSLRDLDRAINLGCWFSTGPAMLTSERGRVLAARIPRERVLTESDGPFAQLNKTAIMPWQVVDAMRGLADLWQASETTTQQSILDNFRRLCAPTT